jgi:hypothetical protein
MAKIQFTSASVKDFKAFINLEHKSLSSCMRTLKENWSRSALQKVARKDGLNFKDINPAYLVEWLDGSNYCQNKVLGRMVVVEKGDKAKGIAPVKEFRAWDTWTPGRVLDYLRRASAAHWKALNK